MGCVGSGVVCGEWSTVRGCGTGVDPTLGDNDAPQLRPPNRLDTNGQVWEIVENLQMRLCNCVSHCRTPRDAH